MNSDSENARIKDEYARRDSDKRLAGLYDRLEPSVIYIRHEIERHIALFLNRKGLRGRDLSELRLLDAGCGGGAFFNMFVQLGFRPQNLYGAELLFERLHAAGKAAVNDSKIVNADAAALPFADSSFDFVSQFTVFSSVLGAAARASIASEMRRVTKNGGYIISYDMQHTNPFNKNLAPLKSGQLKNIFGARPEACWRIVLNPLLLRRLVKHSKLLCDMISVLKIFNSFNIAFIKVEKN
jgi:SAM-dependent methyltransferase